MRIYTITFIVVSFILISVSGYSSLMRDKVLDLPPDLHPKQLFIAHGGGRLDGASQSNSYEAVMNTIELGCRLIELDLLETKDGGFVASHDWGRFRHDINYPDRHTSGPLSSAEIGNSRLFGKYNILSIEDIKNLLRIHGDIFIFTDQTTNYRLINTIGYSDRFFVETFNIFNYLSALQYGIKRPLLNVDGGKFGILVPFFSYILVNPKHVTVSVKTVQSHPWFLRLLANRGVQIYIFTVNDHLLASKYIQEYRGIIYSDDLLENCRKT